MRQLTILLASVFCVFGATAPCSAQSVLWDQQPDTSIQQIIDQDIPDQSIFSTFAVNDVSISSNVVVDSVTTYFTNGSGAWASNVNTGILNIFDGDALTAQDDPTSGGDFGLGQVQVTVTDLGNNILAVSATGFLISLDPGTYWFGLSPISGSAIPQEFHYSSGSTVGAASQSRNPGGGFGLGTDWFDSNILAGGYQDAALTVTIVSLPEPTTAGLFVIGMLGLGARRRR